MGGKILVATKYVYLFSEGNGKMRELLGGKGANLAEMTNLGMPVPQGFTITTEACTRYYEDGKQIAPEILEEIMQYLAKMEEINGKKFGDVSNPLLVSVRSGARASMPGMMDTILNLGLNDEVVVGFAKLTNNERFAYDSYRRFIQMFSDVVMELPKHNFEEIIDEMKEKKGVKLDTELDAEDLKEMVSRFKAYYKEQKGVDFPQDPKEQLLEAIKAVFRSWDNPRAIYYRRMKTRDLVWGTAVNVQAMVFGNMGDTSGTGVAFSRNPAPVSASCTASTSSTLRARTSSPASVPPRRSTPSSRRCPTSTSSLSTSSRSSRTTTATCRIWSSPSRTASSTCCRPATASVPPPPPSRSPAIWSTKG